ncbi:hypothetical protein LCGC14_0526060 [marine sediment metagenome]|uniref:RNase H type-1 domain-containing protein n=1 Tax=marine sediment metagenome TaxID=412755 RepID=A0A0F9SFH7_9ZZZZ|nr:ribonuclease HI family protein [Actinomycetota bacterium]
MMISLFVDGAARGNPGLAGIGAVIKSDNKTLLEAKEYIGDKTNNEAEYISLIYGLGQAAKFGNEIRVFSDSELIVNQVNGEFKVKQAHLKSLLEIVKQERTKFSEFKITHIPRAENKEADELANEAIDEFLDGKRKQLELGYQKQEKLF